MSSGDKQECLKQDNLSDSTTTVMILNLEQRLHDLMMTKKMKTESFGFATIGHGVADDVAENLRGKLVNLRVIFSLTSYSSNS